MAIEKGLYAAPQGLDEEAQLQGVTPLEIEIEDPESVKFSIDGQPILEIENDGEEEEFSKNLAEDIPESFLQQIGRAHV